MRKKSLIVLTISAVCAFAACSGNHAASNGGDSVKNNYSAPSNIDTSRTTTTTGEASSVDNSGSGGTKIVKDTSRLQKKDSSRK